MSAPAIRLEEITVRFGALTALSCVTISLEPGERHAIVGENGAGKSTLMNVLFGLVVPDEGKIFLAGKPQRFSSPREAIAAGIGMVHQHFDLIPAFTVAENIVLGAEPGRGPLLDMRAAEEAIRHLAAEVGLAVEPGERVENLSVAAQQRVEILKALWREAKVLILDEPTAMLTPGEARDLWKTVEALSAAGRSVLFITHRLDDVFAHADRVSVLRRGECVLSGAAVSQTSPEELARAMVGSSAVPVAHPPTSAVSVPRDKPALHLRGLSVRGRRGEEAVAGVSLDVFPGEILGLAGVDGSGQAELIEAIVGLRPASGKATISGQDLLPLSLAQRRGVGLAYIPEDRHRRALAPAATVEETAILGRHREPTFASRLGVLKRTAIGRFFSERAAAFDVRGASPGLPVGALSGGNQQKLILARELSRMPSVLVAVQPTRGLDFAATAFVHEALRRERERGAAVLLQSLDLSELLTLCDRIAVMLAGKIVAVLERGDADEERLGALMTGAAR